MKPNEIELNALTRFQNRQAASSVSIENDSDLTVFALVAAMELSAIARAARLRSSRKDLESASRDLVTLQYGMRNHLEQALKLAMPDATLIAEDAMELPAAGVSAVLDAIDGTHAFLSHGEVSSVTFSLFDAGEVRVSFVANPATGEIAWAQDQTARLVQLPLYGIEPTAAPLPLTSVGDAKPLLVSIHAYKNVSAFLEQLYGSWSKSHYDIVLIKAYSGSPSWALVEAARGHFVYINIWDKGPAAPQDLAAALHILRAAGGDAVCTSGEAVPIIGHEGAFIAGAFEFDRSPVMEIVNVVKQKLVSGLI